MSSAHPGLPGEPALLQDHPDSLAKPGRLRRRVQAEDADRAGRRRPEALQDLQGGGLARAVRAEQAEYLAGADVEVDATQHLSGAEGHLQAADLDGEAIGHRGRVPLVYDARVSHHGDYMK
jgi:hypothetical protein